MGLLNTNTKNKIRSAIKLVTDTFMVTPIDYIQKGTSVDLYQEDNQSIDTVHELNGLVEYPDSEIKTSEVGSQEPFDVKITFNFQDLKTLGLIDTVTKKSKFNAATDHVRVKYELYKVTYVGYDGPLDEEECLIIVLGVKIHRP